MKHRLAPFFILLCILPVLTCYSFSTPSKSLFDGVWQFMEGTINDGERGFPTNVELKIFSKGRFERYIMTSRSSETFRSSVKTMNGTFKILNDSVYTETLIQASNAAMIGKKYVIKYRLRGNSMLVTGFYDVYNNGIPMKVNYFQTWKRIDYREMN
jgi:hypothetical protein